MVLVSKNKLTVCVCVGLTKLNKAVCREKYILPSVEQTLGLLGGAKVFRVLADSTVWSISQIYNIFIFNFFSIGCRESRLLLHPSSVPSVWSHEHIHEEMQENTSGYFHRNSVLLF